MKKMRRIVAIIIPALLLFISCNNRDELNEESVLVKEIKNNDELDTWLYNNYTKSYNIDVKYRWDANNIGLSNTTTPVEREQVKPTMEALKILLIEPYKKVTGDNFLKTYAPKEIYLYGSRNLDTEGYEQIKSNHTPLQMPLFRVNDFKKTDSASVVKILRMAQHHFIKALIHKKPFDKEAFFALNFYSYNDNWGQLDPDKLYDLASRASDFGYYSMFAARGGVEEDFAETASALLCNTKQEVDDMIYSYAGYEDPYVPDDKIRAKNAIKTLEAKRDFIIKYFKDNFDVNFKRLQFETNVQLKTYIR
ncbi:substrate import-associated zinc metallohydrolase lipoprotein [Riemerella columbipharyngis]|uniref:Substrate import-associated zinc metallohydrolase lipoprotein n=2 Tax=Riemerella columbipharyngis TaxID=1071918 RepID=A0A1G6Y878_9FLAO|nr:substrate import-associated zinc metallohydrolase lipoprotein [Riemerella columbipharyngis]